MAEDWITIHGNAQPGVPTRIATIAESSMQPTHVFIDAPGGGELLELYVCDQPQNNTPYGVFQSMEKPGIRLPKCVPVDIGDEVGVLVKMAAGGSFRALISGSMIRADDDPLLRVAEKAVAWHAKQVAGR